MSIDPAMGSVSPVLLLRGSYALLKLLSSRITAMHVETALNLIWLIVSAALLIVLSAPDSFSSSESRGLFLTKRVAVLCLVAIFVFPCISASDDLWSFQNLPENRMLIQSRQGEDNKILASRLARFFESLQTLTLSRQPVLSHSYYFLGLALYLTVSTGRRNALRTASRSPPVLPNFS
jgi:hypothetical protein